MQAKEYIIYGITILFISLLSLLLNLLIFGTNYHNFVIVSFGTTISTILVDYIISKKFGYQLDIFAYDIKDSKYLILNSIFIGALFSIPIAILVSLFL